MGRIGFNSLSGLGVFCAELAAVLSNAVKTGKVFTNVLRFIDLSFGWHFGKRLIPFLKTDKSVRPDQFKTVAGSTIPMWRGHAADEKQAVAVHSFLLCVEQFLPQVPPLHQTDYHSVITNV